MCNAPKKMFCLDFAAAFVVHFQLAAMLGPSRQSQPVFSFGSAALSGAAAAVALCVLRFTHCVIVTSCQGIPSTSCGR